MSKIANLWLAIAVLVYLSVAGYIARFTSYDRSSQVWKGQVRNFLDPKFLWTQNFVGPEFFLLIILSGQNFIAPKNFLYLNFCVPKNFLELNIFFGHQIFRNQNFFYFGSAKHTSNHNIFGPKIFSDQIFFIPKI